MVSERALVGILVKELQTEVSSARGDQREEEAPQVAPHWLLHMYSAGAMEFSWTPRDRDQTPEELETQQVGRWIYQALADIEKLANTDPTFAAQLTAGYKEHHPNAEFSIEWDAPFKEQHPNAEFSIEWHAPFRAFPLNKEAVGGVLQFDGRYELLKITGRYRPLSEPPAPTKYLLEYYDQNEIYHEIRVNTYVEVAEAILGLLIPRELLPVFNRALFVLAELDLEPENSTN